MDYRALAELAMFSLLGLSVFVVAVGFTVRAFVAPTLREILGRGSPGEETRLLAERLGRIEDRLDGIESDLERVAEASEFDRRLEGPKLG
jgi:hypothetical protein